MKGKKCYRIGGRTCDAKCAAFDEDTGECFVLLRMTEQAIALERLAGLFERIPPVPPIQHLPPQRIG